MTPKTLTPELGERMFQKITVCNVTETSFAQQNTISCFFSPLVSGNVSDKQATCSSEIHIKGEQENGMPLAFIVYLYPAILPDKQRDQVLKMNADRIRTEQR